MNPGPVLANTLWLASGLADAVRFRQACFNPATTQERWLRHMLVRHADSAFGRAHDFPKIHSAVEFQRAVPLARYEDFERYVVRIARGERDVLACGPVSHLAPTSGSTGGRKFIPFTPVLTASFRAAVSPWMIDLVRLQPGIAGGPAYWSISPLLDEPAPDPRAAIPIGFADDADYLGGPRAWLVRQAMAVPSSVRFARDTASFWRLTLLSLLRHRELRLISIWHPSFLQLLIDSADASWPEVVEAVQSGECPWADALPAESRAAWQTRPAPERAAELRRIGAHDWPSWWPALKVVSCWGEQAAEPGWRALVRRLPRVLVQAKGLLATEGVVTIPIGDARPLAITSHFFEFIDDGGEVLLAHQLERGQRYEVVLTNGGGLWRYRLGDVVECTGHLEATPCLQFAGRARVSDLRGEKLSEAFVADVLRTLWEADQRPLVATLRALEGEGTAGYELLVSADNNSSGVEIGHRLEAALAANPHYALARRLGQLAPVTVVTVASDGLRKDGARIGDAKPRVLVDRKS